MSLSTCWRIFSIFPVRVLSSIAWACSLNAGAYAVIWRPTLLRPAKKCVEISLAGVVSMPLARSSSANHSLTRSWSVSVANSTPEDTKFASTCSGLSRPSESVVWKWRSAFIKINLRNIFVVLVPVKHEVKIWIFKGRTVWAGWKQFFRWTWYIASFCPLNAFGTFCRKSTKEWCESHRIS